MINSTDQMTKEESALDITLTDLAACDTQLEATECVIAVQKTLYAISAKVKQLRIYNEIYTNLIKERDVTSIEGLLSPETRQNLSIAGRYGDTTHPNHQVAVYTDGLLDAIKAGATWVLDKLILFYRWLHKNITAWFFSTRLSATAVKQYLGDIRTLDPKTPLVSPILYIKSSTVISRLRILDALMPRINECITAAVKCIGVNSNISYGNIISADEFRAGIIDLLNNLSKDQMVITVENDEFIDRGPDVTSASTVGDIDWNNDTLTTVKHIEERLLADVNSIADTAAVCEKQLMKMKADPHLLKTDRYAINTLLNNLSWASSLQRFVMVVFQKHINYINAAMSHVRLAANEAARLGGYAGINIPPIVP